MAEPLSFVASVIAVANLAEAVVTKGYRYIKAVKDCPEDVRKLMAEVNVLCGVLDRLVILLRGRNHHRGIANATGPNHVNVEDAGDDSGSGTEEEEETPTETLKIPSFIYECQRTLEQIQDILHKFGHSSDQSSQTTTKKHRFNISALRHFESKDLKWPLSRSRTLELIASLERHKATCALALAGDGVVGVHSVLKETQLSNKCLAEIRAKQETMFKLQLNQEEEELEKALAWLSPVDPALKHRAFARDRQDGTGFWLFDLPEMKAWLETPKNGLWIWGIPGAGKTTLSTLVVDEVLSRKRSTSVGTAYFYIRHDDKDSHKVSNVLGSLIAQLARQDPEALADLMEFYAQYSTRGSLATPPDDHELNQKLRDISRHFTETYIMIDGLDECGPALDPNRKRLIDTVAGLHGSREGSIGTLIFSRDEYDIRNEFDRVHFHVVSIAATSADLLLYVNAWLGRLEIRSEKLKTEIIDTLVDEANGMFMWVRAQVDYLQRLPNDAEKRRALKKLPPDLPQTYIRILETVDSIYPVQTTKYIQRLLKWLVYGGANLASHRSFVNELLTIDALCEAICIEDESDWPTRETIPTKDQVLRWLGCLGRMNKRNDLQLSHFTVKEFLRTDSGKIPNPTVRKYLFSPEDEGYLVDICLTYVLHNQFQSISYRTGDEIEVFLSKYPFYGYVGERLVDHLRYIEISDTHDDQLIRRFLSVPRRCDFKLWATCHTWLTSPEIGHSGPLMLELPSPIHFASATGLASQVARLLEEGADPDATELLERSVLTPLHFATSDGYWEYKSIIGNVLHVRLKEDHHCLDVIRKGNLKIARMLVDSGADVNRQLLLKLNKDGYNPFGKFQLDTRLVVTPLILALLHSNWEMAGLLLDAKADWDATAYINTEDSIDMCSVKRYIDCCPSQVNVVQNAAELSCHSGLQETLAEWRLQQDADDADNQSTSPSMDSTMDVQDLFIHAFSNFRWQEVQDLLAQHANLDVDCLDERGFNALHHASVCEGDALSVLLEYGAAVDKPTQYRETALFLASGRGYVENMRHLLRLGANIEHRALNGCTPLCLAVSCQHQDAVQLLLETGADINATLDDGLAALHIAIRNRDTNMASLLLASGIEHFTPSHYGTTAVHDACHYGLEDLVEQLLGLSNEPQAYVNANSLNSGTPLYNAARQGYASIINILLDHGAIIDKVGPGNKLGSALMAACAYGHGEAVKALLEGGAALEVEGSKFKSAEGTARAFRKEEILKILEEHERASQREGQDTSADGGQIEKSEDMDYCVDSQEGNGKIDELGDKALDAE
ncbi:MAG: hypothetical protein Q9166_000639 [cf. Caloplaca sp. 2 TL-2023]